MNSLFFRKETRNSGIVGRILKLFRNKRFVVRFVLGLTLVLYVMLGSHGIIQRIRLQQQKAEWTSRVQEAEAETRRLQAEAKALDGDPKAIEKVAREKYGMIREGETVYKVDRK